MLFDKLQGDVLEASLFKVSFQFLYRFFLCREKENTSTRYINI